MSHPDNKRVAKFLLKEKRRVFVLDLNAADIADQLCCSEERAERIIEEMSNTDCSYLWNQIWNFVDECASEVPDDPIADLMDAAKKNEK